MPRGPMLISLLLCGASVAPAAADSANELANPGFELGASDAVAGWEGYGRGYVVDRSVFRSGGRSIRCAVRDDRDGVGAVQIIQYEKPDKRPVIVGGWCKTEDVGGGGDCSVYLDIIYEDDTPWWSKTNTWSRGTHDWEYNARQYWPTKPIKEIRTYVFLRRTTGTAWFDDIKVCRGGLHLTDICVASDYPRRLKGLHLSAGLTLEASWRCDLLTGKGRVIDSAKGSGREVRWLWPGQSEATPATVRLAAETPKAETMEFLAKVTLPTRRNPVRQGYVVWVESSMRKIYPTAGPPPDSQAETSVTLARNEHEGVQIAIKPADDVPLRDVRVELGPFVDEKGEPFPAKQIQWHVVGYVWVGTPSGHPLAPRVPNWCPDVLLPAKPFDVIDGRTQTVWLDFHATEQTKPGVYQGQATIQPANAAAKVVPLRLQVRSLTLPRTPRMKTAFAIMDGFTAKTYGKLTPQLRRACLNLMLDHRLNPDDISRTEPPRIEDLLYARECGMNTFNILNLVPKPKGSPAWVCYVPLEAYGPGFNQRLAERLDAYMVELRKHNLSKMAYFYGFDERREDYDDLIKGICKFLKERYPEVSTFTTAGYMYHKRAKTPPGYRDYMDWYCPLTSRYEPELSAKLRAMGKQVWWYVCCGPKHPYANFASMDYPTIEGRLLAWMTWGHRADGLLFWHVNYWARNAVIDWSDPYLDWQPPCVARMTGDGCLTYPTPDGPVSSIRLENVRDGVEDYDYLSLVAETKGWTTAMGYFDRLVKSMKEYTRDPAALRQVRDEMARAIEAGSTRTRQ